MSLLACLSAECVRACMHVSCDVWRSEPGSRAPCCCLNLNTSVSSEGSQTYKQPDPNPPTP
eukprot:875707-Rhodomonas_salina.1